MAVIKYRVHTTADPLSTEGVILFTRGRRPNMRDYEAFAGQIGDQYDVLVHAIYEGDVYPSLTTTPVFEGPDHKMLRDEAIARNTNLRMRLQPLYRLEHSYGQVADYMETLVNVHTRQLERMKSDLSEVQQRDRLHTWDAPLAQIVGDFVENAQPSYQNYLGYLAREEAELSYQLSAVYSLAEEATREKPCCSQRAFIVEFEEDRWRVPSVWCGHCGTKVEFPEEARIPWTEEMRAELEQAA